MTAQASPEPRVGLVFNGAGVIGWMITCPHAQVLNRYAPPEGCTQLEFWWEFLCLVGERLPLPSPHALLHGAVFAHMTQSPTCRCRKALVPVLKRLCRRMGSEPPDRDLDLL